MELTRTSTSATVKKYIPRGTNVLNTIFKNHFKNFTSNYEEKYEKKYGAFRLERISSFVDNFMTCGDYIKGIARIQCENPECKHEIFRPFSCKKFTLCPSCTQKRAILLGEHIANNVLLNLPHRQFVFTFPKILRPYFRNNKLFSEISQLINTIILDYYTEQKGDNIKTGSVIAYQSFGEFVRFNPHFHAFVLEGCFDEDGNFFHIPIKNTTHITEYFRRRVIQYFLESGRISKNLANNLLSWKHSGFSIDNSVLIFPHDNKAKEALAQYMARYPVSLNKIMYEPVKGKVLFHTKYNSYFKENLKVFDAEEFIAELTQHIPLPRMRLIRYYGLYSSRSKQKWCEWEYVSKHGPTGWKEMHQSQRKDKEQECKTVDEIVEELPAKNSNKTWARLIAKIYEVDPLVCPHCGSRMRVISVITDYYEIKKILGYMIKIGKSPPCVGSETHSLN